MLQNNLDPEVAERPDDLVVYGGTGRAARDWASFDALVRTLTTLGDDETLLVQSGRPVGVLRTHEWAPRVLIANSNLVGDWATWPEFRRLERLGLTMYGQMTAGSWIYIGTQGILQGTYETFAAVADKRFGGSLAGTLTVTGGCGGMGGAQPLAVTMNGGVCLVVDVVAVAAASAGWRPATWTSWPLDWTTPSSGVCAAPARRRGRVGRGGRQLRRACCPSCCAAGVEVDIVTDQTSRARPAGLPARRRRRRRLGRLRSAPSPRSSPTGPGSRWPAHVEAMVGFLDAGAEVFDYGNSIRDEARQGGYDRAFAFPGFVPGLHPAAVLRGQGAVPVGGAVRRPGRHRGHRPGGARAVPRQRQRCSAGSARRGRGSRSRGCRRGSAGWGTASGTGPGCGSTRWSRPARWPRRS